MMKTAAMLAGLLSATSVFAMDQKIVNQLEKLDPDTRLEQTCDTEAMARISADKNAYKPDKVIAYTFAEPVVAENAIKAPGAVFRSKGEWYHLNYDCTTGPEQIDVKSLSFQIGEKVPKDDWQKHYLYD